MNYRLPDNVVFQEVGDDMVLLNLESGLYFGLNESGAEIYRYILKSDDLNSIGEHLTEFEVDSQTLAADARALLEQLLQHGLIEEAADTERSRPAGIP